MEYGSPLVNFCTPRMRGVAGQPATNSVVEVEKREIRRNGKKIAAEVAETERHEKFHGMR